MNAHKKTFFSGIKWSILSQIGNLTGNYLTIILLSLLLSPEDFGLVTLSTILVGFAEILNGFGAGQWIISQNITDEKRINEIIGNTLVLSLGLLFLCAICALPFSNFYSENPLLLNILLVSACSLPINALQGVLNDIYAQQLKFRFIGKLSVIAFLLGNVTAVASAYAGLGVWALVIKNLMPALIAIFVLLYHFPYRFRPCVNWNAQTDANKFQWHFSLGNTLNYFSRNLDYMIIGHFFSTAILGQYSIAYRIMLLPLKNLSSRVNSVLFPMLAKQADQPQKVLSTYLKVIEGIAYLAFPAMALIGLTARLWVPVFFDSRYTFLPPLVEVLSIIGAFQAISSPIGSLFLIRKQTRRMLQISLFSLGVLTIAFLLGAYTQDIILFAAIYGISYVLFLFPVSNKMGLAVFEGCLRSFFKAIYIPIIAVIPMCVLLFQISNFIADPLIALLISLSFGILCYLLGIQLLSNKSLSENLKQLKSLARQIAQ
jgi:PST family polysaccharide transporter